jgi:sigma-E factor negative regulatory protein RseA
MESISALMDGELDSDEAAREILRIKQDAARRDSWDAYHVISDALRGGRALSHGFEQRDFERRLSERLALEPTVMAPRLRMPKTIQTYALSAAASVAAVAVVGWVALNTLNPDVTRGTLAQAPITRPAAVALQSPSASLRAEPAIAATEHVHEYLLAHQGISPTTAIQGVTPYIRTVSNTGDAPGLR